MLLREQQNMDASIILAFLCKHLSLGNKTSFDLVKDSDMNHFVVSLDLVVQVIQNLIYGKKMKTDTRV